MSGISTNRSAIALPTDFQKQVIQKMQGSSVIMRLATRSEISGNGATIPVITGDPEAAWIAETGQKPVSNPSLSYKVLQPYKLAVLVPFSDEFRRDLNALYNEIVNRLPGALALKFDETVIGKVEKPGENFDSFSLCTAQSLIAADSHTAYKGLVNAYTDIADHGGSLNGFAISPTGKGILLDSVDSTGRPIFIPSVTDGGIPMILGERVAEGRGVYKSGTAAVGSAAGTPAIVGVAGDWTKAIYGTVGGVKIDFADQATITIASEQVNLFEHNMFAVRAEIEIGFRAVTDCFNVLTGATPSA